MNKYQPHVLVLPEDDANRQVAVGFRLDEWMEVGRIQILPPAAGWLRTLECLRADHLPRLIEFPCRHLILLIDFDDDLARVDYVRREIPEPVSDRVFVLGTLTEPERLRSAMLRSYEEIGRALARDCREGTGTTWSHRLLVHNRGELDRLRILVRPFLFAKR